MEQVIRDSWSKLEPSELVSSSDWWQRAKPWGWSMAVSSAAKRHCPSYLCSDFLVPDSRSGHFDPRIFGAEKDVVSWNSTKTQAALFAALPALFVKFAPLVRLWTLRFDSKHSYFKRCARHLKNVRNICQTLSSDVSGISFSRPRMQ